MPSGDGASDPIIKQYREEAGTQAIEAVRQRGCLCQLRWTGVDLIVTKQAPTCPLHGTK